MTERDLLRRWVEWYDEGAELYGDTQEHLATTPDTPPAPAPQPTAEPPHRLRVRVGRAMRESSDEELRARIVEALG